MQLPSMGGPVQPLDLSAVGDCNSFDQHSLSEVGIRAESLSVGSNIGVRLEAHAHTACVSAPIKSFSKLSASRVQFRYRTIRGKSVRFCLLQEGLNECATMPPLSQKPGWHRYKEIAIPEIGAKGLQLFFYADGTLTGTSTEYRSVRFEPWQSVSVLVLEIDPVAPAPSIKWSAVNSSTYQVHIDGAHSDFVLYLA